MKLAYLAYIAFIGALAFLILVIADRQQSAALKRLSDYALRPRYHSR
jgi:hypothetical protein